MAFNFSRNSRNKLQTCDPRLVEIFEEAIAISPIDFGIASGHRSVEEQQKLYARGRTEEGPRVTNVDGINNKSKHNISPSKAIDIFGWVNGKINYEREPLCLIAGVVLTLAHQKNIPLRWGGNWDRDGEIITDQSLIDLPHFELDE